MKYLIIVALSFMPTIVNASSLSDWAQDQSTSDYQGASTDYKGTITLINNLAVQQSALVTANKATAWKNVQAAHKEDLKTYKFSAVLEGIFLNIDIRREANFGGSMKDYSTVICLAGVSNIILDSGTPPDEHGTVSYDYALEPTDPGADAISYHWLVEPTPEDWRYVVTPNVPVLNGPYQPYANSYNYPTTGYDPNYIKFGGIQDYNISLITNNYPEPAVDDKIIFQPTGFVIFVPQGDGAAVLHDIESSSDKLAK